MSKVEKHPIDEGKFQSTFDKYGHGKGSGKSRNSIYKHHKKWLASQETPDIVQDVEIKIEETPDIVQDENEESAQNQEFSNISWAQDEEGDVKTSTIPKPIADMAKGKVSQVSTAATGQLVRWGFVGLDRLITHWGRGGMGDSTWALERSSNDLEAMESSTVAVMEHYGVSIGVSPVVVWGGIMSSAYVPPILHVRRNADPNRVKRKSIFSRLFRRRKKNKITVEEVGTDDLNT